VHLCAIFHACSAHAVPADNSVGRTHGLPQQEPVCGIPVSQKHDELPVTCAGVAGESKALRYCLLLSKAWERQLGSRLSDLVRNHLSKRLVTAQLITHKQLLALGLELASGAVCDLE